MCRSKRGVKKKKKDKNLLEEGRAGRRVSLLARPVHGSDDERCARTDRGGCY